MAENCLNKKTYLCKIPFILATDTINQKIVEKHNYDNEKAGEIV